MNKCVLCAGILLGAAVASQAIINPNFTPKDLAGQADLIVVGTVKATDNPMEWQLVPSKAIKGDPGAAHVLSLANCHKDHAEDIAQALKKVADEKGPAILFAGTVQEEKRAYVHVAGLWLDARPSAGRLRYEIAGPAAQMTGTYAGGTDMLIRMTEYLVRDPDAVVPVSAGVRWLSHAKVGKLSGEKSGLEAVEIGEANRLHLFAASSDGDRLYRPKKDEEGFEDATAGSGLDTRSRAFLWLDVNRDGLADLVSWDGSTLSVRLAAQKGTFRAAADAWVFRPEAGCTGLAACGSGALPGVLVSTDGLPVLVVAEEGGWKAVALPGGPVTKEDLGRPSPCIVADLDNDGFPDVLLPAERGGILWRGTRTGFEAPVRTDVSTGEGVAIAAVGDFDGDGFLDLFLAGTTRNSLWENDGHGRFAEVLRFCGSISYKCPPGALAIRVMDLNHDGWPDLGLCYGAAEFLYHFNRGFRAFGEEGEVRLPGLATAPGQERAGQRAIAAADFNGDGSQDLAVLFTNGDLCCYFNDRTDMPGLRLRLPKGATGPVTASCWIGPKSPVCTGTASVAGHSPAAYIAVRAPGEVTVRYRLPGKAEQTKTVTVKDGTTDVILNDE